MEEIIAYLLLEGREVTDLQYFTKYFIEKRYNYLDNTIDYSFSKMYPIKPFFLVLRSNNDICLVSYDNLSITNDKIIIEGKSYINNVNTIINTHVISYRIEFTNSDKKINFLNFYDVVKILPNASPYYKNISIKKMYLVF